MISKIESYLDKAYPQMVDVRRYLHQHPELSFQEYKTAAYIAAQYEDMAIEVRTNVGGNGVVARLKGGKPGKKVALRADFDALPIQDEKDVPYRSTVPGVMHACGHDAHTSILLHIAKALHSVKDELCGEYIFIHQHAEEYAPGGAKPMIEDGALQDVDVIYGTHLWASEPVGHILYTEGPLMAASDRFTIEIQGKGGHGATPHLTHDAITIGAQLILNLQQIVSRIVNPLQPCVVSVGSFKALNAFNVIADRAEIIGTVRTFDDETRNKIELELQRIAHYTCEMFHATASIHYDRGYPALVNHPEEAQFIAETAAQVDGVTDIILTEPHMGGEDFAYYLQEIPGCYFFTGAAPEGTQPPFPHHHPKFDIQEQAMLLASKVLVRAALNAAIR
ncbi:MAG: M20 metallopeptidase family protein [Bacilli bacterium]